MDVQKIMKLADRDHNNHIDFEEFCTFMEIAEFAISVGVPGRNRFLHFNTTTENAAKAFLAGGIAGAISRSSVAPFERMKIMFQTQGHPPKYKGIMDCMTKIYRGEGIRGYFSGNGTNIVRIFPTTAIQFLAWENYKKLVAGDTTDLSIWQRLIAGGLTGITALTICYPLDFVRGRLSVQTTRQYNGIVDCLRSVIRKEGFIALYRGLWPSILGVVPYVGIDFAAYETLKDYAPRNEDGTISRIVTMGIGGLAGSIAQTTAYPLDLVRRRLQVQGFLENPKGVHYKGMFDAFKQIWRTEGFTGFYRGLAPNYLKVVPALAVQFTVWEEMKRMWNISK
eukprot:TRINITY_DN17747_c0_g1_i1.p1 TRINITY_DN17747_c0_g1~~TRINITY_DN17747_c0_g1_i1.p1  ORF type:complete len:392 (-),score=50.22 TRINITY_DN17747_c0_g1_i1:98-1108(-)